MDYLDDYNLILNDIKSLYLIETKISLLVIQSKVLKSIKYICPEDLTCLYTI